MDGVMSDQKSPADEEFWKDTRMPMREKALASRGAIARASKAEGRS
jgi:hypothetical protein